MSYHIETSGAKGNAYCVMGQVITIMSEARETMGWDDDKFEKEKEAYLSAAQSSDYQNLLEVSYATVDRVNKMVETLSDAHKIRMYWKTLEFYEGREFLNTLPDKALDEIYGKIRSVGIEIPTYEEYKKSKTKYHGETCFVAGCNAPAPYEGGDARYYCPMCERHSGIRESYVHHIWRKACVRWLSCYNNKNRRNNNVTIQGTPSADSCGNEGQHGAHQPDQGALREEEP